MLCKVLRGVAWRGVLYCTRERENSTGGGENKMKMQRLEGSKIICKGLSFVASCISEISYVASSFYGNSTACRTLLETAMVEDNKGEDINMNTDIKNVTREDSSISIGKGKPTLEQSKEMARIKAINDAKMIEKQAAADKAAADKAAADKALELANMNQEYVKLSKLASLTLEIPVDNTSLLCAEIFNNTDYHTTITEGEYKPFFTKKGEHDCIFQLTSKHTTPNNTTTRYTYDVVYKNKDNNKGYFTITRKSSKGNSDKFAIDYNDKEVKSIIRHRTGKDNIDNSELLIKKAKDEISKLAKTLTELSQTVSKKDFKEKNTKDFKEYMLPIERRVNVIEKTYING
jgi:hypothetical protein